LSELLWQATASELLQQQHSSTASRSDCSRCDMLRQRQLPAVSKHNCIR
jgi:hypothetical protein